MSLGDVGKILPIDGYIVELNRELHNAYTKSLTHLYQPLIGLEAISLYQTLLTENECYMGKPYAQTHHVLMQYMRQPLDEIYKARKKLEGIGLMQTYKHKANDFYVYTYSLHCPFTPKEFFADDMLSQLLYHQLGKDKFEHIKHMFIISAQKQNEKTEVTANFEEVFSTYTGQQQEVPEKQPKTQSQTGVPIETQIDFQWVSETLEQRMLPVKEILTASNRKLITQMSSLYDLASHEIEKAMLWAIDDRNFFNAEEFKAACMDFNRETPNKQKRTKLLDEREKLKDKKKNPSASKEDQLIARLEQISPRQLLADLSVGKKASKQDLKMIGEVMTEQGLQAGVMNVLIHYVMLKTDMKLSKSYLEKIASHWARKNVTTVRQAMTLAKSENNKYQQWRKYPNQNYYSNKSSKTDILPDWFKEQKNKDNKKDSKKEMQSDNDKEQKAKEADQMLANYLARHSNE
ncbi:replication initiation and membrane attachment family protein [Saliterribacillus persicus]|uniref:Replicative DNA helicase loader DnaB n=1 Tax=Saliterribacillus persicus TaxID=930114 RepID=A0A368XEC7_9BACI|nr:DnaD domain protein [Saliterribacillus persicus]RCW66331.1 replicative DNA helicase loader DnaB [Saliterribacillus persicus]